MGNCICVEKKDDKIIITIQTGQGVEFFKYQTKDDIEAKRIVLGLINALD